jgi:hypothetical protein
MVLSKGDSEIFLAVPENPPEAPKALIKAVIKEHQDEYGNW